MKVLPRVLFILKYRHSYTYGDYSVGLKSGLLNSAKFVSDMLVEKRYDSHVVEVTDNNSIDREVTKHRPDIVILEALWVVPEKLNVLKKLHPNVKWVVRLHSEIPFLANEGIAMDWINRYLNIDGVHIGLNSHQTLEEMKDYLRAANKDPSRLIYLPNYYPVSKRPIERIPISSLHVGCFGAIRPLKNHLTQAFAAIEFAKRNDLILHFHINATRKDGAYMEPILDNLRALFAGLDPQRYVLEEQEWLDRPEFLHLVRCMDIGLQVSMSESFNIVSADFVSEGVPLVTSKEVRWMPKEFQADPTNVESIVKAMKKALDKHHARWFPSDARRHLEKVVKENADVWTHELFHLVTL